MNEIHATNAKQANRFSTETHAGIAAANGVALTAF
jgi:hypothetical protein